MVAASVTGPERSAAEGRIARAVQRFFQSRYRIAGTVAIALKKSTTAQKTANSHGTKSETALALRYIQQPTWALFLSALNRVPVVEPLLTLSTPQTIAHHRPPTNKLLTPTTMATPNRSLGMVTGEELQIGLAWQAAGARPSQIISPTNALYSKVTIARTPVQNFRSRIHMFVTDGFQLACASGEWGSARRRAASGRWPSW